MLKIWMKINLWKKNLIALVLGILVGFVFKDHVEFLHLIGNSFLNLLKMMVMPLIFISLIHSILNLSSNHNIVAIICKAGGLFLFTAIIAIVLAIAGAVMFEPGIGVNISFKGYDPSAHTQLPSILETVLNVIPSNPFKSFVDGNVIQVIFLAIFTGIILAQTKEDKTYILNIVNILNDVVFNMIHVIMHLLPIGIFALLAYTTSVMGYEIITKLSFFIILTCALCVIQVGVIYPILLILSGHRVIEFYKGAYSAIYTAFFLSSSSATLPVSMECAKKLKITEAVRSLIIPIGSSINMNGSAIQQVVITIFIAQLVGMELNFDHYCVITFTTLIASIGSAGVPGSGLLMSTIVLNALGLPVEGIAIIAGVDKIIDMFTTAVNVTGDLLIAKIVAPKNNDLTEMTQG